MKPTNTQAKKDKTKSIESKKLDSSHTNNAESKKILRFAQHDTNIDSSAPLSHIKPSTHHIESPIRHITPPSRHIEPPSRHIERSEISIPESKNIDSIKLESAESSATSSTSNTKPTPKAKRLIQGAYELSLGISIVVAILLGLGLGLLMQHLSGSVYLLWLGLAWGIGAAILNIYKAYKRALKQSDELANDPKYAYHRDKTTQSKNTPKQP